jgi:hypothetical protein
LKTPAASRLAAAFLASPASFEELSVDPPGGTGVNPVLPRRLFRLLAKRKYPVHLLKLRQLTMAEVLPISSRKYNNSTSLSSVNRHDLFEVL